VKAVFTVWNGRIAPVFDTAKEVCLVEAEKGRIVSQSMQALPLQALLWLAEQRVDAVVCGAISRPLHAQLNAAGIRVTPFVAGDVQEVIRAWLAGLLGRPAFAMPGCCGRRRMRRGCCRRSF